ncbi:hypothetical protein EMIT0P294_90011 [Pseudomonas sp. IT-P294]
MSENILGEVGSGQEHFHLIRNAR